MSNPPKAHQLMLRTINTHNEALTSASANITDITVLIASRNKKLYPLSEEI